MTKLFLSVIAITATLFLAGCATFQGYEAPHYDTDSMALPSTDKLMTYSVKTRGGGKVPVNAQALVAVFDTYGYDLKQSAVKRDGVPHMYITVVKDYNPAAFLGAVITGLSFYLIPSWMTVHLKVHAQMKKGKQLYDYTEKGYVRLVQWLPMLFAMPFAPPFTAKDDVMKHMYQTIAHSYYVDTNGGAL